MNRFLKIILLISLLLISFLCCNSNDSTSKEMDLKRLCAVGSDIYTLRCNLVQQGMSPSMIVDPTGKNEVLLMSIQVRDTSFTFVDSFGYITGIDLAPWKAKEKSHIIIWASPDGVINKVEAQ